MLALPPGHSLCRSGCNLPHAVPALPCWVLHACARGRLLRPGEPWLLFICWGGSHGLPSGVQQRCPRVHCLHCLCSGACSHCCGVLQLRAVRGRPLCGSPGLHVPSCTPGLCSAAGRQRPSSVPQWHL